MKKPKKPIPKLPTISPRKMYTGELRRYMIDLHGTPAMLAHHLDVSERTVLRWLADNSAPKAVLLALWYETPEGRSNAASHCEYEAVTLRGLVRATQEAADVQEKQLARLLAISDTGAANDPIRVDRGARPVFYRSAIAGCYSGLATPTGLSSTFSQQGTGSLPAQLAARQPAR